MSYRSINRAFPQYVAKSFEVIQEYEKSLLDIRNYLIVILLFEHSLIFTLKPFKVFFIWIHTSLPPTEDAQLRWGTRPKTEISTRIKLTT